MNTRHRSTSPKLSETPFPGGCTGTVGCTFSPSMTAIRHRSAQKLVPNEYVYRKGRTRPRVHLPPPSRSCRVCPVSVVCSSRTLTPLIPSRPWRAWLPALNTYGILLTVPAPECRLPLQLPAPSRPSDPASPMAAPWPIFAFFVLWDLNFPFIPSNSSICNVSQLHRSHVLDGLARCATVLTENLCWKPAISSDTRWCRQPTVLVPGPAASGPRSGEVSAAPISTDLGQPLAVAGLKAGPESSQNLQSHS